MYINISVNCFSPDYLPSSSTSDPIMGNCFRSKLSIYIFSFISFTYILPLPLFIHVLYLGYQQWRKQGSVGMTATSHSDIFTYHSIAMQLNELLGLVCMFCGGYIVHQHMWLAGFIVSFVASLGQALFHLLTCVERYLAVVHPFTYLRLTTAGGLRIRNISVGCVWLLSFGLIALSYVLSSRSEMLIMLFCVRGFFIIVVTFCSISVLCALKRPGPGEAGGNRERVDQSKQRAFHTILAITGVLLFKFVGNLICLAIIISPLMSSCNWCVLVMSAFWFDVPSCLVLPLLFLRGRKLGCC